MSIDQWYLDLMKRRDAAQRPNVVQMEIKMDPKQMEDIMSVYSDGTSKTPGVRTYTKGSPLEFVQSGPAILGPVYTIPTYPQPVGADPRKEEGKTAAIIGVGGQDGSYLSELLISLGYKVSGICRRNTRALPANVEKLMDSPDDFTYVVGDVTDQSFITNYIAKNKPDYIYNLAAQSHVGTSFNVPHQTFDVTATAVLNVLEAVRQFSPKTRVYQASSSEMFGNEVSSQKADGFSLEGKPLYRQVDGSYTDYCPTLGKFQNELTRMVPRSPYGVAKLAAHNMIGMYREAYGIFAVGGILFNHESERRGEIFVTRKVTKYLARLAAYMNENRGKYEKQAQCHDDYWYGATVTISGERELIGKAPRLSLGNLSSMRDWGHAEDYVRAMVLMMQADKPRDYVVGSGKTHTIEHFVDKAFAVANVGYWKKFVDIDETLKRPAEVDCLRADPSKIKQELGWAPRINFDELVRRMVEHDLKGCE